MNQLHYSPKEIEAKWQKQWKAIQSGTPDVNSANKRYYNLMMFPYPSAEGLHVGNMYAVTGSDIYGRFKQMQGYTVLEPIGLDGFGIHSENYAMKIGKNPFVHAEVTEEKFYIQLEKIGALFDWTRTVETYKKNYYRWTQWVFLELYKKGLVYRANSPVNWCPSCKTVLADEQVIDGRCERCSTEVIKKDLTQWFIKITHYAEKLDAHLDTLDWSEKVKVAQKQWIGKKQGISITYPVTNEAGISIGEVSCFTTRPETNFGATFVVLAPEHPFINQILKVLDQKQVDLIRKYVEEAKKQSDIDRINANRKKTGISTTLFCENRLTGERMPLYISDFVLMNVGTGAVVGVPGHDTRDFEFAQVFNLPVKRVVVGNDGNEGEILQISQVYEGEGTMIQSGLLDGLGTNQAKEKIQQHLEEHGWGKKVTTYHLRDWLISRQRYWGPPIPLIYCESCAASKQSWFTHQDSSIHSDFHDSPKEGYEWAFGWYPVPDDQLPVELPFIEDFRPGDDGIAPLKKHKEFYETTCPGCGGNAVRETDVSDTFLDSSWYFLRYPSVGNDTKAFDESLTKQWLPVDMYTGGAEHAVLHLMYARFITMALCDIGHIDFDEPFSKFFAHGLIIKDGHKMSKSKGNVVNPDEYIETYGSDALRCYLMFMGPFSEGGDFRDTAMEGMYKWTQRIWRMFVDVYEKKHGQSDTKILNALHRLIKKVGEDMERRHYNTSLAAMMEFTNLVSERDNAISIDDFKTFALLLAPFAPHMAEEMYQRIAGRDALHGHSDSIHYQLWPMYDEAKLIDSELQIIVQVNGKVRGRLQLSAEEAQNEHTVKEHAQQLEGVKRYIESGIKKAIFIPGKIINFVV